MKLVKQEPLGTLYTIQITEDELLMAKALFGACYVGGLSQHVYDKLREINPRDKYTVLTSVVGGDPLLTLRDREAD